MFKLFFLEISFASSKHYWRSTGLILNFIESSPLPGVCSELADIFIILLHVFNVDLALYCCLGCLKRRNVRQGP